VIPRFPVYIFDVDGTLLDSARDICGAIQTVLADTHHSRLSDDFLRRYIGLHLIELFRDLFPEYSAQQIDEMIVHYRQVYPARDHALTRAYPGVAEVLAALPGKKSTATTKGTPTTRIVLERFGLLPYFHHVQGTDGFPAKPEPDVIFRTLAALGVGPDQCLFVGDSAADMEAGRRAGVKTCGVLWGYGVKTEMERWQPDYWITEPAQLAL